MTHAREPSASGPAHQRASISRAEVIKLGQSGSPWEFLQLLGRLQDRALEDPGLRFLCAANLAKLGLSTLASEQLAALPRDMVSHAEVLALSTAIASLADDELDREAIIDTCRENVRALVARHFVASPVAAHWLSEFIERASQTQWFRAVDGNIVRRSRDTQSLTGLQWLWSRKGEADQTVASRKPSVFPMPITIDGVDPPWLAEAMWRATPRSALGYQPRITILEPDGASLMDGLALSDLRDLFADPRVRVFVGEEGLARFTRRFAETPDTMWVDSVLSVHGDAQDDRRELVTRTVTEGLRLQSEANAELVRSTTEAYAAMGFIQWGARYREAQQAAGRDEPNAQTTLPSPGLALHADISTPGAIPASTQPAGPLRVLLSSCRFTTFIKHSIDDLASALEAEGCQTLVALEPDDTTITTSGMLMRACRDFRPDLIITPNYPRATKPGCYPENVPYVCWVQDAMPQLFEPRVSTEHNFLDFFVGHNYVEMLEPIGIRQEQTLRLPVVASERKFHAGPITPRQRKDHACEIAIAMHHGETPEALHARLLRELRGGPGLTSVLERVRAGLVSLLDRAGTAVLDVEALSLCRGVLASHPSPGSPRGSEPDARTLELVRRCYALPMLDRMLRHETATWAANIAERRGWKLKLFGKGWSEHPRFRAHASGELEHGEELRASYQSAIVHLHASVSGPVHQRVMECALSGGLPLCRFTGDYLEPGRMRVLYHLGTLDPLSRAPGERHYSLEQLARIPEAPGLQGQSPIDLNHEAYASAYLLERDALGAPLQETQIVRDDDLDLLTMYASVDARGFDPLALLGGRLAPSRGGVTFRSEAELEQLIERGITRPDWRAECSSRIADHVRRCFTHRVFAQRTIRLVHAWVRELEQSIIRTGRAGDPPLRWLRPVNRGWAKKKVAA
ncbi:MAG: hypothetical protein SFZ23_03140 [Planctomycetota bacterium]|nr:hypothetical protein [Planctomycetota bacterium]